ncbi:ABC transporter permease [Miniphocaeibacter halophilus]|uniref:ABC transporter permease n=1 Tax=Miniphocaeibacter halophilus TaxID=2931922 RepID=A0AC61N3J6_9FIRM|nr:ABC transporter permease [Miniphocaeibacter halophilus]QQK07868.1 ABC transporter permease [Miniphocaeibacter halophilus]
MIIATLKQFYSTIKKNFASYFFTFLVMPIGLSLLLSSFNTSLFSGEIETNPLSITIKDKDKSDYSKILEKTFEDKEMKKFFKVEEKGDYLITIPKEFENEILESGKFNITVETIGNNSSIFGLETIESVLNSIGNGIVKSIENNKISQSLNEENLKEKVFNDLTQIQNTAFLENRKIESSSKLTSQSFYAMTLMQFLFLNYLVSAVVGSKKLSETTALFQRIDMLPVNKIKYNLVDTFGDSFILILFAFVYILIYRVLGKAFTENLGMYFIAILIISITVGFILFLFKNIKKEVAIVIANIAMYLQLVFGGMLGPVEKLFSGTIMEKLSNINFNKIFLDPLMNAFNNNISLKTFIPHIIVIAVCITASSIIITIKEKERIGGNYEIIK